MKGRIPSIPTRSVRRGLAALLCLAICMAGGLYPIPAQAAGGNVHVYEETPGDTASDKYTLTANGTEVPVIKYAANGNNFDVARFSSDDPAPTFQVTVKEEIQTVNVYPVRYYPQENIQVSGYKHTVTFSMSAESNLRYAFVMINGGPEKQDGKPYLAIINDPTETGQPDADASNVLNFQTFMEQYLKDYPNSEAEKAEEAGTTSGNVAYEAGQLVENFATQVRFPNKRRMLDNDATLALQAALDEIYKEGSAYNTLYFPAGEYTYSGLEIRNRKGKQVNIYVEEGALLKNRIQECMQAMEPAIGIWDSEDITISGRGIFDGNGVENYRKDRHDAKDSCHQGGVMIVRSSNITFNDTYVRDAKQWNWESHGSKNCTLNNIKGLTPYPQPWVDGLDMASAQNLTINGALTLGNDDCFASGHHNPSDGFPNTVPGFDQYNSDALAWDVEDSFNVSVNNTLGWSNAGGNGIRMGHNTYGHQMKNYSFNNLNAVNFQGGGRGITVQNNTGTYPRYEEITIANCSFDTTRVGTNFEINGKEDDKIQNVRLDNCWFSGEKDSKASNIANFEITNLYVGGKLVEYTSQGKVKLNGGIDSLTYTANGEAVKGNTLPVITYPEESLNAYAGNPLVFYVKAEDPDAADSLVFGDVDLTGLDGAKFDKDTGEFSWTPSEANVGNTYPVTFTVTDCADQPIQRTVRIQVGAADKSVQRYDVEEDAHLATWKDEKTKNTGGTKYLTTGKINGKGLMNEGFTNTSTTDTTDGKVIYLKFDLTEIKKQENLYDRAELVLTYVNKRKASDTGENQVRVAVVDDSNWDEKTITWNNKPAYTATEETTKVSNTFDLGEVALDKPGDKTEPAINGTKVITDIKDFIDAAIKAGKDQLTLVVCETKGAEIYFVSREGAVNYKNATPDMAPAILLNIPTSVDIEGPAELTVREGYPETKTNSFALKGTGDLTVELICENGDGKITWNEATQQIAIAEGLKAGTYPVTVKVTNSNNESKTVTFTLTVEAGKQAGTASVTIANWQQGTEAAIPVPVSETNGTDHVTYQYKVKGADDSTYTDEVPAEAGEYTLKAVFAATDEYYEVTVTCDFVITEAAAVADKESLKNLYDENQNLEEADYTAESWAVFAKALENAKAVLEKADATQAEVDAARQNLINAIYGLGERLVAEVAPEVQISVAGAGIPEASEGMEIALKAEPVEQLAVQEAQIPMEENEYLTYDICLINKVTSEVIPLRGMVIVAIPIPEGYRADDLNVYHVHGEGADRTKEEKEFSVSADGRNILVQTDKFSYFILAKASSIQTPQIPVLKELKITPPAKSEYTIGEELDKTGLIVTAVYDDGSTKDVTGEVQISGYDKAKEGEQMITVSYGGLSAEFKITVKANDQKPGGENPGTQKPGGEKPGTQTPGGQTPGGENPGTQTPGGEKPGTQTPDDQKPVFQDPAGSGSNGSGQNGTTNSQQAANQTGKAPKTGDVSQIRMFFLLCIISLFVVMMTGRMRRQVSK